MKINQNYNFNNIYKTYTNFVSTNYDNYENHIYTFKYIN